MKHIIVALLIALFMVSCMGSAGAHYSLDKDKQNKQEKMDHNMGGGY